MKITIRFITLASVATVTLSLVIAGMSVSPKATAQEDPTLTPYQTTVDDIMNSPGPSGDPGLREAPRPGTRPGPMGTNPDSPPVSSYDRASITTFLNTIVQAIIVIWHFLIS